jgi:hypothetical protein
LLFVTWVVLLIDHNQLKMRNGCENGHPGSQNDPCVPKMCRQPSVESLCWRELAVKCNHCMFTKLCSKPIPNSVFKLWCQVDFWHHDQALARGGLFR